MKENFYAMMVRENQTDAMERVLIRFRIGLNNWDKTRVLYFKGEGYVSYTILCTADTFKSIKAMMKEQ